ncbi:GGDEF domain-containing protein [Roseovarius gahaiensis]|uniref:GGDEF domain-containing protein n=1 Tax=Roseovarius gahaiensis TaxID=2716691 RepID=A0A967BCX0_9RHOB|nr:GGDEF domain-containing phosphodiesterase [Roseovarius gahaiensis]NHQ74468.1 GGDEF domain-containing protein [Roseovarius gahaiensis]
MPLGKHKWRLTRAARQAIAREGMIAISLLTGLAFASITFGAQTVLLGLVFGLPTSFLIVRVLKMRAQPLNVAPHNREPVLAALDSAIRTARRRSANTACIILQIDSFNVLCDQFGPSAPDDMTRHTVSRLKNSLRRGDQVFELDAGRFCLVLRPSKRLTQGAAMRLCDRLRTAMEEPFSMGSATMCLTVCIGHCLDSQSLQSTGHALINAADLALEEARRHGPASCRGYAPDMKRLSACPPIAGDDLTRALDRGEFQAWFQPQISTDTGALSGVEALARWHHPERGILAPAEFLPLMEQTGRLETLGHEMLRQSLEALKTWDKNGLSVPRIGLNLTPSELRQPIIADHIAWELDRHGVSPDRLAIEVLENVVAQSADDTVVHNINTLAKLGCMIDLDDFGTGHASLSSLRGLAVGRLKIDRSFVTGIDANRDQQRMVSAILSMSETLALETLAEGVETAGEHAMLAQLGCGYVQGFGIGRPMPSDQIPLWIKRHNTRLAQIPGIVHGTG